MNFCRQNISYIVRFLLIKSYKKSCKLLSNYTENYVDIKRNKRQTKVKTFAEKVVEICCQIFSEGTKRQMFGLGKIFNWWDVLHSFLTPQSTNLAHISKKNILKNSAIINCWIEWSNKIATPSAGCLFRVIIIRLKIIQLALTFFPDLNTSIVLFFLVLVFC